jgi:ceramide glucosyltransferase
VILNIIFGFLALLSFALLLWQWLVARRFPLHQRIAAHSFPPAVTLLKPLKGCEPSTDDCLRSWFLQEYTGRVQFLFGVDSADDPVVMVVRKMQQEFPASDSQLIVCGPPTGPNAKVSKLVELHRLAKHDLFVVSDADVRVTPDFLANVVEPLREAKTTAAAQAPGSKTNGLIQSSCGLVNCFYRLANPTTLSMQWEAIAINADFWSQVLQSQSIKPLDFALGAVMVTRRQQLEEIGGFAALVDCLADDYQLGHRIAQCGHRIELSTVVVECWSSPMTWSDVWKHQLRWARTIRVCQPVAYFFSILSNATLWPLAWLVVRPGPIVLAVCLACWLTRIWAALDLQQRLNRSRKHFAFAWLALIKDLLQVAIWMLAFAGNRIEWRGQQMRLQRDGTLTRD